MSLTQPMIQNDNNNNNNEYKEELPVTDKLHLLNKVGNVLESRQHLSELEYEVKGNEESTDITLKYIKLVQKVDGQIGFQGFKALMGLIEVLQTQTRTNILAKDIIYTFLATFFILFGMFVLYLTQTTNMYVGTFNKHCDYKSTVSHKLLVNFGSQDDYTFLEILPYKALSYDEILSAEIPNLVPFGCYSHNGTEFGQWKIRTSLYLATYSEREPCVKNINSSLHLFLPTIDDEVEVILLEQVANNVPRTYEKHLKELENLVNFCQMRRAFSPSEWLALFSIFATSISLTIGIITYKRVKTVRDKLKADWDIRISEVRNKILDREFELREALEDIRKRDKSGRQRSDSMNVSVDIQ